MREIEFRAKNINDQWRYGYLERQDLLYDENYDCSSSIQIETIGQYTGLKDKNGTKIFEGDIVKGITEDTKQTNYGVIKYGKYKDENFEDSCLGFYLELNSEQFSMFNGEAQGYDLPSFVKVVGNIYDNPELLEVE